MRWARRIAALALFVGLLVGGWRFAAENSATVNVDYLAGRFGEVPIWTVIFCSFMGGVVVTGLVSMFLNARLHLEARRYRKAVRGLESEVHELRNLPLDDQTPEPRAPADELAPEAGLERGT